MKLTLIKKANGVRVHAIPFRNKKEANFWLSGRHHDVKTVKWYSNNYADIILKNGNVLEYRK